jgi:hypothetical protein
MSPASLSVEGGIWIFLEVSSIAVVREQPGLVVPRECGGFLIEREDFDL